MIFLKQDYYFDVRLLKLVVKEVLGNSNKCLSSRDFDTTRHTFQVKK